MSHIEDEIQRIRSLYLFDREKPILEQIDNTPPKEKKNIDNYMDNVVKKLEYDTDITTYPNYCKYPDKALEPPKFGEQRGLIDGYCYYASPTPNEPNKTSGIHLPQNVEIIFQDQKSIINLRDKLVEKYENNIDPLKYLDSVLPLGTVAGFGNYRAAVSRQSKNMKWSFKGYFDKNTGKPYTQPKWEDRRTEYQQFIDEWGIALQMGVIFTTAIITSLAGVPTGPAILIELLVEMGVGIPVALREFEKGQNVSGTFSIVSSLLPVLKYSKAFRGVKPEIFDSLTNEFKNAGFDSSSTWQNYKDFYLGLKPEEQKLLSSIMKQDELSLKKLITEVSTHIPQDISNLIIKSFATSQEAKDMYRKLDFWKRLWARELGMNGIVLVTALIIEALWGKKLNDQEKLQIENIYQKIPPEHQQEFIYNIANNPPDVIIPSLEKLSQEMTSDGVLKYINVKNAAESAAKWYNTKMDEYITNEGGTYIEIETDSTKSVVDNQSNPENLKWVRFNDLDETQKSQIDSLNLVSSGGEWYVKLPQNKEIEKQ